MITEYVRKSSKDRTKVGALAAYKTPDGQISIGFSRWNERLDDYDPKLGMKVAKDRAQKDRACSDIPRSLKKHIKPFVNRAKRYFKTENLTERSVDQLDYLFGPAENPARNIYTEVPGVGENVVFNNRF